MKSLAVDFRAVVGPPRWALASVGVLSIIAVVLAMVAFTLDRQAHERMAERDAERQRALSAKASADTAPKKMPYDESAREFVTQATSQWPTMLTALESMEIPGVVPVSIDVSANDRSMRVEVEFSDYSTLLQYVDALNAGDPEPHWALLQAQVAASGAATAGGSHSLATLRASW